MDESLKQLVLEFLQAYYDPRKDAPPFYPKLKALEQAVGFDAKVWGVRTDTGEWTYE
jgi:hypothetical protein